MTAIAAGALRPGDIIDVGQPARVVRVREGIGWLDDGYGYAWLVDWESTERLPDGQWRSAGVLVRSRWRGLVERIEEEEK